MQVCNHTEHILFFRKKTTPQSSFFQISDASTTKDKDENDSEEKHPTELDKYWKSVNDDPTDFTAWTYLLQYVDQEVHFSFIMSKFDNGQ